MSGTGIRIPYQPVSQLAAIDGPSEIELPPAGARGSTGIVQAEEGSVEFGTSDLEPLELEGDEFEDRVNDANKTQPDTLLCCSWQDLWFPSLLVSVLLELPVLWGIMWCLYDLTGRTFVCLPFAAHAGLVTFSLRLQEIATKTGTCNSVCIRIIATLAGVVDVILLAVVYPELWKGMIFTFFTEPDGTTVVEWSREAWAFRVFQQVGLVVAICRILLGCVFAIGCIATSCCGRSRVSSTPQRLGSNLFVSWRHHCRNVTSLLLVLSMGVVAWCGVSAIVHFGRWSAPAHAHTTGCDEMDTTECWLPFPSMEFMKRDPTTATGWRVNLNGQMLPPLKGNVRMDPQFLNELDGFSTMGSILFYLEGLKEAHEAGIGQLQGPASIAQSVTANSVTLLLDVNASALVPHSAEIDYLDPAHPLVLVFPAQPLKHANHYALAVVNAKSVTGELLTSSVGLTDLWRLSSSQDMPDRVSRYQTVVIPSLEQAAPWFNITTTPNALQLLFDFVTISEVSQLGPVRAVRDASLAYIRSPEWGTWDKHVRVNHRTDHQCSGWNLIARTVHAELDVPWYLEAYGPGQRGAILNQEALSSGIPVTIGVAKFVVHIPCSVRNAAIEEGQSKPLRAIMEYGHGLFYSRQEASDTFLQEMANDQGYVIVAMDWRGMSIFDLPVVIKTLLSKPRLFRAVRDNLIQGYSNKFALLHFTQSGMLDLDWFQFETSTGATQAVPTYSGNPPVSTFYGISQGGILGAGYAALSGTTGLIDRAILGVPGTPFSLIMTRSLDFTGYDVLMLLNLYNNRHVRALLALVQMGWDSVEGSGVLALPVREPIPRMLLQCGLGDVVVPTIAAEALARGLNASTLPNNPRSIYGIPISDAATDTQDGPKVTLTEMLYEMEYATLPRDDTKADSNSVHECVRRDFVLIWQVSEFINTGRIVDVCVKEGCRRSHSC